jgi:PAS domain S-box-containing protein
VAIGTIRDITEIRKVEQALRDPEDRLSQIFRCISDAIILARLADSTIKDVNEAFERVTAWSRAEVIGRRAIDFLYAHPHDREVGLELLKRDGYLHDHVGTTRKKSGEDFYNSTSIQVFSIKGEACLIAVVRDITDRKRAQLELIEEKERAQLYFDIAGAFIVVLDAKGHIRLPNCRGHEMLGYQDRALQGKDWFETVVSPPQRAIARAEFLALMSGQVDRLLD